MCVTESHLCFDISLNIRIADMGHTWWVMVHMIHDTTVTLWLLHPYDKTDSYLSNVLNHTWRSHRVTCVSSLLSFDCCIWTTWQIHMCLHIWSPHVRIMSNTPEDVMWYMIRSCVRNYRSLLQKSPIKKNIFRKRDGVYHMEMSGDRH